MLTGYGAGAEPTATAVLSDIITVAQGKCPYVFGLSTNELSLNVDAGEKENYRYYFRLNVIDKSGVLAGVTEIFRKYSLSIESLIQRGRNPNEEVPVIITTAMNVKGEPILNPPEQAYNMLTKTDMDYLFMKNFMVKR